MKWNALGYISVATLAIGGFQNCGKISSQSGYPTESQSSSSVAIADSTKTQFATTTATAAADFVCSSGTNLTAEINARLLGLSQNGGGILRLAAGRCLIGGTAGSLSVPSNVVLQGAGSSLTQLVVENELTICQFSPSEACPAVRIGHEQRPSSNARIQGLQIIDVGSVRPHSTTLMMGNGGRGLQMDDVSILNAARYGVLVQGVNDWSITNSYIERTTSLTDDLGRPQQVQTILVSDALPTVRGVIAGNLLIGAGINLSGAGHLISNNVIRNFVFGGGIVSEQSIYCYGLRIAGNVIHGGRGYDVNQTWALGIEQWCRDTQVVNNIVFDNDGSGIDQGGKNSVVKNNTVFNNGRAGQTRLDLKGFAGLTARDGNSIYNASGTVFDSNDVYETSPDVSEQSYGYHEEKTKPGLSTRLSSIRLVGNTFWGNAQAATDIVAPSTQVQRPGSVRTRFTSQTRLGAIEVDDCFIDMITSACSARVSWSSANTGSSEDVQVWVRSSDLPVTWRPMARSGFGTVIVDWMQHGKTYYFELRDSARVLARASKRPVRQNFPLIRSALVSGLNELEISGFSLGTRCRVGIWTPDWSRVLEQVEVADCSKNLVRIPLNEAFISTYDRLNVNVTSLSMRSTGQSWSEPVSVDIFPARPFVDSSGLGGNSNEAVWFGGVGLLGPCRANIFDESTNLIATVHTMSCEGKMGNFTIPFSALGNRRRFLFNIVSRNGAWSSLQVVNLF